MHRPLHLSRALEESRAPLSMSSTTPSGIEIRERRQEGRWLLARKEHPFVTRRDRRPWDAKLIPDVRVIESPCYAARQQDIAWAALADVRNQTIDHERPVRARHPSWQLQLWQATEAGARPPGDPYPGPALRATRQMLSDASSSGACTDLDPFRAGPCVMHRSSSWT
jgi:hypothetical protein